MQVFIGGSRSIKELDEKVVFALYNEFNSGLKILVGDADGVDAEVQRFCARNKYPNVLVYASNGRARNNIGGFEVKGIKVGTGTPPREFFVAKDIAMTDDADCGIVIWDGKSKGSLGQVYRLIRQNKPCSVYLAREKRWVTVDGENEIDNICGLRSALSANAKQLAFF